MNERPVETRRDVLLVASGAFAAVGAGSSLWPLLQQMGADLGTRALATVDVDLSQIGPGRSITVLRRGKPVFIRHRTGAEIARERAVAVAGLIDRRARMAGLGEDAPASDGNRVKAGHPQWLVVVGVCTHLGCVPRGQRLGDKRGDWGGWLCSCHGSQYDGAGRVRKGPAPDNLFVPPYHFLSSTRIEIGRLARDGAIA
jgi:ubiquinol-cytochrome c reductase iron-sulfur subunit